MARTAEQPVRACYKICFEWLASHRVSVALAGSAVLKSAYNRAVLLSIAIKFFVACLRVSCVSSRIPCLKPHPY